MELSRQSEKDTEEKEIFPIELAINQTTDYETPIDARSQNEIIINDLKGQLDAEVKLNEELEDHINSNNIQRNELVVTSRFSFLNPFNWIGSRHNPIEEIEKEMFKSLKTSVQRYYVYIRNKSLRIWTMSANTTNENTPIVLVHGFCGGIALWVHNVDALSENRPFYAFDLLGFARSSRPPFSNDPIVAEGQFVESIEDWRKEVSLKEMILLGHSFGGYIATAYSLKYPKHIKALILADPWGFPDNSREARPDAPTPLWISVIAKASQYVSPLSIFRVSGQIGVTIFKHIRPDFMRKFMNVLDNPEIIYSYLYHANNLHPSGEAGFRAVAEYFGFAKNPMIKRIDKVKENIPIFFIYGSRSWIDCTAGFSAVYIRQRYAPVAPVSVEIISGAGHHVYADRPNEFNDYVKYVLECINDLEESNQNFAALKNSNSLISVN